ncbi:alpha-2-macroglobulin family protein [Bremerella sp. T1]|uniref:alpha-2-macroglobulin family protein n=1 Tax=Bremerella sp. TYQ1 TaxID=3119568 RepID=UPI001CC9D87F|nr:MG2 domain-containing protein [Bremerella volcania]UBM36679.1 alpha-2-macroglobulin [Bremerella volcania]
MKTYSFVRTIPLAILCCCAALMTVWLGMHSTTAQGPAPDIKHMEKLYQEGNYKEAYETAEKLFVDANQDPKELARTLQLPVQSLQQLGRYPEVDAFLEKTATAQKDEWRVLQAIAQQYRRLNHWGVINDNEFQRGPVRGGGKRVNSIERDQARALQLFVEAMKVAQSKDAEPDMANLFLELSQFFLNNGYGRGAWQLQYLTDVAELPDYQESYNYGGSNQGAPVDEEGNPIFYPLPKSWEDAKNDGERMRWAMEQVGEYDANRTGQVKLQWANFLNSQFGVQTLQQYQWFFAPRNDESEDETPHLLSLGTLKENETIARLATGIKRFELPDEFNHIKVWRQLIENKDANRSSAYDQLASIFENRRQYPAAAQLWREAIEDVGPGNNDYRRKRLAQITDNLGQFQGGVVNAAGKGATLQYLFRNGEQVDFTAHEIDIEKLLADTKQYLKSNPGRIDYQKMQFQQVGEKILFQEDGKNYLGEEVAKWTVKLDPRPDHLDRRIDVHAPLTNAGAYMVTAKMKEGNVCKLVVWVADTVIVSKQLDQKKLYFVADAVTGKPIEKANVEYFGYKMQQVRQQNRFNVLTKNFAELTDADGQVILSDDPLNHEYQWLVVARTDKGRFAYMGFQHIWYGRQHDATYNAVRSYGITDRPVYRPDQTMKFKFWTRRSQYDQADVSQFAGKSFQVHLRDPQGNEIFNKQFTADEYGGVEGTWDIPADAKLGQYNLFTNHGNVQFRVEEYKKPEFEVTVDAPEKPVQLGETITATINAKYYFGSPVTNATVKYKVERSPYNRHWYPTARWDWCFGGGYWWFAYDYTWYPGFQNWVGCTRPAPFWIGWSHNPPELVAEQEVEIGEDGTVQVEIDTALAKALHGNEDHQYTITAEVRDQSRRTIVGSGKVLVARKPFKVYTWVDRGYYDVGDSINAHFLAQTLDGRDVAGKGELKLFKITYDDKNQPIETEVQAWDIEMNGEGTVSQTMKASAAGQYRLSLKLTDEAEHTEEGGYIFTIRGDGFDGSQFRFNDLELIPDKKEYKAGDTVRLQINTNRVGSTVLLFVRPSNSVYLPPKVIRLTGKSTVHDIAVLKKDMPNFFVEAITVADAKVHDETKEIVVPPETRVLDMNVETDASEYLPGSEGKVKITLTDETGEPFMGSAVLTVYDKSVEYISGGSNVEDIKEFFWKWRRHHHPQTEHSLNLYSYNLTPKGEMALQFLGAFGRSVADEDLGRDRQQMEEGMAAGFGSGGPRMLQSRMRGAMAKNAMADAMPMAAAPMESAELAMGGEDKAQQSGQETADLIDPTVRSNFADTALWVATVETNEKGEAEFKLDLPENLTSWKIRTWAMGHGTKVGSAESEVVTRKNLIIRLQAPRFFVQKDEVVLSANVHNYLDSEKSTVVSLDIPTGLMTSQSPLNQKVTIPAGGEVRVDWTVKVTGEGEATITMKALTDEESDAMQQSFPVFVHGMLKTESWAGTVQPEQDSQSVTIHVPDDRRPEDSRLIVRYSPSLAGAMVEALPYLVDYPYGCTEQTLNRFVPTVITRQVLEQMGIDLKSISEHQNNLNAQEIGDPGKRNDRWNAGWDGKLKNPVFDDAELDKMVKSGVQRLTEMQNSDGGWGWFSGYNEYSYPHTTAVVVRGLTIAKRNGAAIVPDVIERGQQWLINYQKKEIKKLQNADEKKDPWKSKADNLDAVVFAVLAENGQDSREMRGFLYRDRTNLSVYGKALFALALHQVNDQEKLEMLRRNLDQYLVTDQENETAYLKMPADSNWWYWYGDAIEANAYYLKLLAATDADNVTARRLVKYLLNNRKHATYWKSTRDTALCIEAMADYLRATDELNPEMAVEILIDGEKKAETEFTKENLFTVDNTVELTGIQVTDGEHKVEIRRKGRGPVYFSAYLTNFTLEDFITKAGLEVKVERRFYRLDRDEEATAKAVGARGQALNEKVVKYKRTLLENESQVTSGDLVEIDLVIESKNDYEYLMFEDKKAAGFEPVDLRSGYKGNSLGAYMELRDEKVAFFVRQLPRGKHTLTYRLRAEIPGKFSALPTVAQAMYAPELVGNSDEMKIQIKDQD